MGSGKPTGTESRRNGQHEGHWSQLFSLGTNYSTSLGIYNKQLITQSFSFVAKSKWHEVLKNSKCIKWHNTINILISSSNLLLLRLYYLKWDLKIFKMVRRKNSFLRLAQITLVCWDLQLRVAGSKSAKPPRPFVLNPELLIVGLSQGSGQLSAKWRPHSPSASAIF